MICASRPFLLAVVTLVGACAATEPPPPLPTAPAALVEAVRAKEAHPCNPQTASALAGRGVAAGDVVSVEYVALFGGSGENTRRIGSQAWVGVQGRSGSIVVDHNLGCGIMQVWVKEERSWSR